MGVCLDNFLTEVGLGVSTLSDYMRHVSIALFNTLKKDRDAKIVWSTAAEQRNVRGLVWELPKCVTFVEGTKQKVFQTSDDDDLDDKLCG